jgi:hypothetical protein
LEMIKTYDEKTRSFDGVLLLDGIENEIDTAGAAPAVTKWKEKEVNESSNSSSSSSSSSSSVGRDNDTDSVVEVSGKKIRQRQSSTDVARGAATKSIQVLRHEIAKTYLQYLILSFFACIPDRQRTFQELELGKNFFKVDNNDGTMTTTTGSSSMWIIKHTADDYKTGATYGECPPLPLTVSLTHEIDDFIEHWRPSLIRLPSSSSSSSVSTTTQTSSSCYLFLQPRTGNPLTANSVYQILSRCCYKYHAEITATSGPVVVRDVTRAPYWGPRGARWNLLLNPLR